MNQKLYPSNLHGDCKAAPFSIIITLIKNRYFEGGVGIELAVADHVM